MFLFDRTVFLKKIQNATSEWFLENEDRCPIGNIKTSYAELIGFLGSPNKHNQWVFEAKNSGKFFNQEKYCIKILCKQTDINPIDQYDEVQDWIIIGIPQFAKEIQAILKEYIHNVNPNRFAMVESVKCEQKGDYYTLPNQNLKDWITANRDTGTPYYL